MAKLATMMIMMLMGARYFTRKLYAFFRRKGLPSSSISRMAFWGFQAQPTKRQEPNAHTGINQTVSEELHKVTEDGGGKTVLEVEPDTLDIKGGLRAGINGTKEEHHHAQNDGSGGVRFHPKRSVAKATTPSTREMQEVSAANSSSM